jgi:glycosyltransferase involved in cell wall biosynthesis
MRIAYLAPFDLTQLAGHTSHVLATVRQMSAKGHEVTLLARGCPDDVARAVRFVTVPTFDRPGLQSVSFGAAAAAVLAKEVVHRRPDAVYLRYFKSASLPLFIARAARIPGVVEVNADTTNERRANRRGKVATRMEETEERAIYSLCSAIIGVTEAVVRNVARLSPSAIGKATVIENGVDTSVYRPLDRTECSLKHGLDPVRKRVVFTGGFSSWQGTLDLVAAMTAVASKRADADLLLVGDGPLRMDIDSAICAAGLSNRVSITGYVPESAVAELIGASDICVAPYNTGALGDTEKDKLRPGALMRGSPLKIYGYLACGRPVITSHFHEAGEYVEAKGAGLAVRPEEPGELATSSLSLLNDPDRARSMGDRGRQLAEESHDWSRVVDKYLEVISRFT